MIKRKKFIVSCLTVMSSMMLFACASTMKLADIPNTANPQEEIAKLDRDLVDASTKNIDVLAANEFKKCVSWLDEAKSDQESKQSQEEVLNDLRKARGFLEMAHQASEHRAEKAPALFESRQAALKAGAANHSELHYDLKQLDGDVSSKASSLEKVDSEKIAALQERYMVLERQATILTQLGTARAQMNGAKKDGAEKRAPLTLKKLELSLSNAESVISANVRNPQGYVSAVATANKDALHLSDVMATIDQNGGKLFESAALQMVSQKSQIKALSESISINRASSAVSQTALSEKNRALTAELKVKDQDLNSANTHVEIQRAIETARVQFSPEEAEAYQQGDSLLIRLKQVNFSSGRADLPGASLDLLAKVSKVARAMHASEIKVEGHTDSVGSENLNDTISKKRASAVASYFRSNGFDGVTSEGYGFKKPISTNKSKEGRAQNRRVDIIITPEATAAAI